MGLARAVPDTGDAAVSMVGRLFCFLVRTENEHVIRTVRAISGAPAGLAVWARRCPAGCLKETRRGGR